MNYTIDYYFDLQSIDNENIVDILKNMIDSNNISDEPLEYQLEILDNDNETIIFKGGEPTSTIPYRYFEEVADYLTHRKREVEEERNSFLDSLFKPIKSKEDTQEIISTEETEITNETELTPSSIEEQFQQPPPVEELVQEYPDMNDQFQQPPTTEEPLPPQSPIIEEPLPPQPTTVEQPLLPQPTTVEQPLPPQSTTVEQPLLPQPTTVEQPLLPQPTTVEQPLLPQPTTVEQPLLPQPTTVEQPLLPQPTTVEQPLPPQPPITHNQIYKGGNIKSSVITLRIIMQKNKALPFLFLKKMRYNLKNNSL